MATAEEYKNMSAAEKKKEDWMNSKWRPMMGWLYMATCTFDFVIFPILWSMLQAAKGMNITQWQPLTLQGAGLYHIAMGAVLGLAAFGRTQEKIAGANNGGANTGPSSFGASPGGFSSPAPVSNSFGAQPLGGNGGSTFGSAPSPAPTSSFSSSPGFGAATTPAVTASGKKVVPVGNEPEL